MLSNNNNCQCGYSCGGCWGLLCCPPVPIGCRGPQGVRGPQGIRGPQGVGFQPLKTVTSFVCNGIPHVGIVPNNTVHNASISIGPNPGYGFISAQIPDNTSVGGDCRGLFSVDWQQQRQLKNEVSLGLLSVISGAKTTMR